MNTSRPRAFIYVGGSYPQIVGIQAVRDAGLYTILTDISANAPGQAYADRFEVISATNVQSLLALAHDVSESFDIVGCYGVADYAFDAIGAIYEAQGIPPDVRCDGNRLAQAFRNASNKRTSKNLWRSAGLPVPRLVWASSAGATAIAEQVCRLLAPPVVVKPATSNSSKGVTLVLQKNSTELQAALDRAGQQGASVMIEEYIAGRLFNVDGLMINGVAQPVSITERGSCEGNSCQPRFGIQPADLEPNEAAALHDLAGRAATVLGLNFGPFTVDVILANDGPRLLELSPHFHSIRSEFVRANGGAMEAWLAFLMGNPLRSDHGQPPASPLVAYLQLYGGRAGTVQRVEGMEEIHTNTHVIDTYLLKEVGSVIHETDGYRDVCGVVWLKSDSRARLNSAIEQISQSLVFRTG